MKKEEMMLKASQMLAKGKFKLKKASPTIMIVTAAVTGVAATVLACKATLKAEEIVAEHNAKVKTIHTTKQQVDDGTLELKDGETYTSEEMKKDITTTYVHTAMWLAKVYAPAMALGAVSLGCMFGSHHIMSKRNASLTAAYIALDKAFTEYKGRVTERFGDRVQTELEQNIKAVEVESKKTNEDGTEELIKEYKDIAMGSNDIYSFVYDETVDTWNRDAMLNRNYLMMMESAANRRLRSQGHLFLNDVLNLLGTHGGETLKIPAGQIVGWIYDPSNEKLANHVDFGVTSYVKNNDALNSFIDGDEPSVVLHFNCDGPIIDKI